MTKTTNEIQNVNNPHRSGPGNEEYLNAKSNWEKVIKLFKHALQRSPNEQGMDLNDDSYLREVSKTFTNNDRDLYTYINNDSVPIQFTAAELRECKLVYNEDLQRLVKVDKVEVEIEKKGELITNNYNKLVPSTTLATTQGKKAKSSEDTQAFIYVGESLFVGPHGLITKVSGIPGIVTHGTYLKGVPLKTVVEGKPTGEAAGLVKIKDGQIIFISNFSGHYKPSELDMYYLIVSLQKMGVGVFSDDAIVDLTSSGGEIIKVNDFLTYMEEQSDGIERHTTLLEAHIEAQIEKKHKYEEKLHSNTKGFPLKLDDQSQTLSEILAKLSAEETQALAKELRESKPVMYTKINYLDQNDPSDYEILLKTGPKAYSIQRYEDTYTSSIISKIIEENNIYSALAMKKLFDAGIANTGSVYEDRILNDALRSRNHDLIKVIMENGDMALIAKSEAKYMGYDKGNILHSVVSLGYNDVLEKLLQYPETHPLLNVRNFNTDTPYDIAESKDNYDAMDIIGAV